MKIATAILGSLVAAGVAFLALINIGCQSYYCDVYIFIVFPGFILLALGAGLGIGFGSSAMRKKGTSHPESVGKDGGRMAGLACIVVSTASLAGYLLSLLILSQKGG